MKLTTRLCAEPGCGQVGVEVAGGWRCSAHRRVPWDRFRADHPERSIGYGSRWRKLRNAVIAANPTCACGVPTMEVHHRDHARPGDPTFYDRRNLEALCPSCHRREGRRRRVA